MGCLLDLQPSFAAVAAGILWLVCASILAWLAVRSRFPGQPAFLLTMAAMQWWLFTAAVDLGSANEACKVGWSLAAWPGITLVPIAWSYFLFDYTLNTSHGRKPVRRLIYLILPGIAGIIALTNNQTHLLYGTDTRLVTVDGSSYVVFDHGPLFYMVAAGLYVFVMSALGVLVFAFVKARKIIRPFLGVLLLITAAPLTANLAYVLWGVTLFGYDPTPFMFAVALIALSWLLLNNTMMDTGAQGRSLLFYATQDPVIIVDAGGGFAGGNPAARALFGHRLPRLGTTVEHLETIGPLVRSLVSSGEPGSTESIRLGGRVFDFRALPIESPIQTKRPLLGWTVSLVDITERENAAEALRAALARAEAANQAKSHFLANVSHEIRTPLNGILGMASVMAETTLDEEQRDFLQIIEESGQVLLTTIGDVLDLSKIEAGKMVVETRPFVLRDALEAARALFAASARKKGLQLSVTVEETLPKAIVNDAHRFRQVLHNLLSNAIKFTPTGGVTITAGLSEEAGDTLVVRVSDTGPGVSADARERIFKPFLQADAGDTRRFGGTGLGLSISRQLCQLMGGDLILVESRGGGATFEIRLPLTVASEEEVAAAVKADAPTTAVLGGPVLDVLVVDDNRTNRLILEKLAQRSACRVQSASSGPEAIDMVRGSPFDIVLMDIQMPEMGGVEATRFIRAIERAEGRKPSFVVAVTANAMPEQLAHYRTTDMDEVLPKPVSKAQLLKLIEAVRDRAG